jgi:nucleotide-binding universal stress UspA family protein
MIKLERILVPTDFSDCAKQAVTYASELAKRFGAELHLLHVVQPPLAAYPYAAAIPDEALHPEGPAKEELEVLEVPNAEQISQVQRTIRTGTPFVDIVRHAKENDMDLIVIGTHGRTGLTHMLLGSVAEKVVRKAPCPVLTVRPKGHQFVMP